MQDVYVMYAVGCLVTPTELDNMPEETVQRLILLNQVADVVTYGGDLKL